MSHFGKRVQHHRFDVASSCAVMMHARPPALRFDVPSNVNGSFGVQRHESGICSMPSPRQIESSAGVRVQLSITVPAGRLEVPLSSLELEQPSTVTNAKSRASGRMVQSVTPRRPR